MTTHDRDKVIAAAKEAAGKITALERYNMNMNWITEPNSIERLRFFLSLAITGQNWLDAEQFIDGVSQQLATRDAEISDLRVRLETAQVEKDTAQMSGIKLLNKVAQLREQVTALQHIIEEEAKDSAQVIIERDKLREQVTLLRNALSNVLITRTAEARTSMTLANAEENFTDSHIELAEHTKATVDSSNAEKLATKALADTEPKK